MNKNWIKKKYRFLPVIYVVFLAVALALYLKFFANGKSLVWSHDGVPQHLNSLAYYGKYLRKVLHTLFIEHKLSLPLWDMHIGYGSDILTTLHYYVIGDPLTLLSVFVPASKTEALYAFLIFLRIYLAGIAFSRYSFIIRIQTGDLYGNDDLHLCRMDDLCGDETSVFFQSHDLPASDSSGN